MRQSVKQILGYIATYKLNFMIVTMIIITANLLNLRIPYITGQMIDAIGLGAGGVDFSQLLDGALMILGIAGLVWVLTIVQGFLMLKTAQSVVLDLRHDVFNKLLRLPVSYFDTTTKGNVISIVSTDIDNISETISADLMTFLTGSITIIGALGFMLEISWKMSCIFLITVPLMFLAARRISKQSRKLFRLKKEDYGELCGYSEEMITAQKTVKVYGIEEYNKEKFFDMSNKLQSSGIKAEVCSSMMMPTMNTLNNLNFTLICITGAVLVLQGELTVGSISTFVLYSKRFAAPVIEMANIMNIFQVAMAACDRVFSILNHKPEEDDVQISDGIEEELEEELEEVVGNIQFEDVGFWYEEGIPILKNINLDIKAGQKIAIVGSTGSGKTTLISVLMRFYDIQKGKITIDGKDIKSMSLNRLRKHFAMVLQDSWLFEGTVYENIAYAAPKERRDYETIQALCKQIGVDEFIQTLPQGYDTVLTGDSGDLSAGQKQLINIARTFMCNPPFFILDEATSSVDPITEIKIKEVTDKVLEQKTSFIIAHRLSTILNADLILVMKDGEVKELGSHKELISKNGLYKNIYQSQFISEAS